MKKIALIILPTYNEADNIEKLIKEILEQEKHIEKFNLKILINDSSSTDKTAEIVKKIIKKYPDKIHLIETKKEGLEKPIIKLFYMLKKKSNLM